MIQKKKFKKMETRIVFSLLAIFLLSFAACDSSSPGRSTGHLVTFDTRGGTTIDSVYVQTGDRVTRPPNPSRTGFIFAGWFSSLMFTDMFDFNAPVTGARTAFAGWDLSSGGGRLPPSVGNPEPGNPTPPVEAPFMEMVLVEAGTFHLGRELWTDSFWGDATPVSFVTLSGFRIGKYPVTQEQFYTVMTGNNNGINLSPSYHTQGPSSAHGETNVLRRPVDNVSWYDAIVFANRLSIRETLTPAYKLPIYWPNPDPNDPAHWSTDPNDWGTVPPSSDARWTAVRVVPGSTGYRLPTEAQWEFAAKARSDVASGDGYTFSGSNNLNAVVWHAGNSGGSTRQVGLLAANALGIYDMSGNVFEWVWDWWDDYTSDDKIDPQGPPHHSVWGDYRVLRGSSRFNENLGTIRILHRLMSGPHSSGGSFGFRVARP